MASPSSSWIHDLILLSEGILRKRIKTLIKQEYLFIASEWLTKFDLIDVWFYCEVKIETVLQYMSGVEHHATPDIKIKKGNGRPPMV